MRAVLFDLWGTLVASPAALRDACFHEMASDFGVDPVCFADAFRESHGERFTGATGTLDETLLVLDELRTRGFLLALVTDSSIETPTLWRETSLARRMDAAAFSCALGVCKPDAALFLDACEGLRVASRECAYVGDGGGHELTAATALGMLAVRLRAPDAAASDRYDDDAAFAGAEVAVLPELLDLPWVTAAALPS